MGQVIADEIDEALIHAEFNRLTESNEDNTPLNLRVAFETCTSLGHTSCVRAMHKHGMQLMSTDILRAATTGHVDVMAYLHENGAEWHRSTTWRAAAGHLSCLKYAHENGAPWDEMTTAVSANGHLDCLMYAYENGAQWSSATMFCASNHLECMIYAHEHEAEWDEGTTGAAARVGNLACLKYAHEHGAPWGGATTYFAAMGHVDCLRYAYDNGAPWSPYTMYMAAWRGDVACVKFCHEKGHEAWDTGTTFNANETDNLEVLTYLIEQGCPFSAKPVFVRRNTMIIAVAMSRRRSTITIQRAWRVSRALRRQRAAIVIEDMYLAWSCRPGAGGWYKKARDSFERLLKE